MTGTLPARVRLSRARGYRLQAAHPGAIVVTRPGRYVNPFTVADALADDPTLTKDQARERCVTLFRLWLDGELQPADPDLDRRRAWILDNLDQLTGHPLACWCPLPEPGHADHCHAAHLIQRANRSVTP